MPKRSTKASANCSLGLLHVQAEELHAVVADVGVDLLELRRLHPAGPAPRSPEVEDGDVAVELGRGELRRRRAAARRTRGRSRARPAGMTSPAGVPATNRNSPPLLTSTWSAAGRAAGQQGQRRGERRAGASSCAGHRVGVGGARRAPRSRRRPRGRRRRSARSRWPGRTRGGAGRAAYRRPSTCSRTVQIGSWWLTRTASCPRAASRAASTAAEHPGGDLDVGLAPGRLERVAQLPPVARGAEHAVPDRRPRMPSKALPASISRSSIDDRQVERVGDAARRSAGRAPAGWTPGG